MKFSELEGRTVDIQEGSNQFRAVLKEIRPLGVFLEVLHCEKGTNYSEGDYLVFSNSVPMIIRAVGESRLT